ncbi:MAG: DUF1064 domain-containing protein [Thermoanaerobaculia bacterium]
MVRWSEDDLKQFQARHGGGKSSAMRPGKATRKYRNEPVEVDGVRFDSKREAARWRELRLEDRAGKITRLRRQVRFSLAVHGEHVGVYVADFVYYRGEERIVEDVKSPATRTPVYELKRRLMVAVHGIEIREVE